MIKIPVVKKMYDVGGSWGVIIPQTLMEIAEIDGDENTNFLVLNFHKTVPLSENAER